MFLVYPLSRFVWNVICCTFGLPGLPKDIHQLVTGWVDGFARRTRKLVLVGLATVFWSIWRMHTLACFQRKLLAEPVSVIVICHWISDLANLQEEAEQDLLTRGARAISKWLLKFVGRGEAGLHGSASWKMGSIQAFDSLMFWLSLYARIVKSFT